MPTIQTMGRFKFAARALAALPLVFTLMAALLGSPLAAAQGNAGLDFSLFQGLSSEDREKALQALRNFKSSNPDADFSSANAASRAGSTRPGMRSAPRPVSTAAEATASTELPLFGYELFGGDARNLFSPPANAPVPAEYTIGPGDVLRVQLFGNQNDSLNLPISRDGAVNFPKLGPIQVAGLKFDDVKLLIERRVAHEMIGVQTNITLGPLRGIQVFLLGDVVAPGSYSVNAQATISNALMAGEGVAPSGTLRDIQLKRGGRVIGHLDLYDFLLRGNSGGDARLQSGDVIFVPPAGGRVAISGAVRRPAIYEIRGRLSAAGAIAMAGGTAADARKTQLMLERINGNGQRTLTEINLASEGGAAQSLRDGDRLRVLGATGSVDNRVEVMGHVRYPALYAWTPGLKLSRVLGLAQVKPSVAGVELYPALGLIERSNAVSGLREWRSFDLATVTAGRADERLEAEDRVVILTRNDIDYLGSAPVRAALRGELPSSPEPADLAVPAHAATSDAETRARPATDPALADPGIASGADSATARTEAQKEARKSRPCEGLAEVVKMSDSARALAIRLALNAQEGTSEIKTRAAETSKARQPKTAFDCPELFRTAPTALVFLLEQGVAVLGEARRPGLYPMPSDGSFAQLLQVAGGATDEADTRTLDYYTANQGDEAGLPRFHSVDFASVAGSHSLHAGDIYQLKPGKVLPEVGSVTVAGEVRFPGRYVISRGEHLADLLARAGGLNENAYPYGAVFTRESTRNAEIVSNRRAASDLREALATAATKGAFSQGQGSGGAALLSDVVSRLENTQPVGRIVIEADPMALAANPNLNLLLEPGDVLTIPKRPGAVTVTGQVLNPGSLSFAPNAKAADYIKQAGGLADAADEHRMLVVLPNGVARPIKRSLFAFKDEPIPPGSVIVVPRDAAPLTGLLLTERVAQIFSNLALSVAALVTITR